MLDLGMRKTTLLLTLFGFFALNMTLAHAEEEELGNELKDMGQIGFQNFAEASRIFIKTTEKAKYRINAKKKGVVSIILENTRVSTANDLLPLDTRFFDTPIKYVQVKSIEGPSQSVVIDIYLRQNVPFRDTQKDNFLAIDFQRPESN